METKTKFSEVAHLYPKCELKTDSGRLTLECVRHDCIYGGEPDAYVMNGNQTHKMKWEDFKPLLRPLSDMTEAESKELDLSDVQIGLCHFADRLQMFMTATQFQKALAMGFDFFGLIENSEAISTTQPSQQ